MKKKITIKKRIEKKIALNNNKLGFIDSAMNDSDKLRIYGNKNKPANVDLFNSRHEMKTYVDAKTNVIYRKRVYVDYDVVICIPSNNRYDKVKRLISQFNEQSTKYTFKLILLNDGSNDNRYSKLINDFPEIIYIENIKSNGKLLHWYCYNQMWENLKNIECHVVLQMDDDFIICDNFLDIIVDKYFEQKDIDNNIRGISLHTWSFRKKKIIHESWWSDKNFVDGISLLDFEVIKYMNYQMHPVDEIVNKPGVPVRAWTQINGAVKNMSGYYYRTPESLVYHDGNNDSKLHGDVRINGSGVFSQKLCKSLEKYCDYE